MSAPVSLENFPPFPPNFSPHSGVIDLQRALPARETLYFPPPGQLRLAGGRAGP